MTGRERDLVHLDESVDTVLLKLHDLSNCQMTVNEICLM